MNDYYVLTSDNRVKVLPRLSKAQLAELSTQERVAYENDITTDAEFYERYLVSAPNRDLAILNAGNLEADQTINFGNNEFVWTGNNFKEIKQWWDEFVELDVIALDENEPNVLVVETYPGGKAKIGDTIKVRQFQVIEAHIFEP
jgi:hypothetical protein